MAGQPKGRKLLVASIGVATVSYVACTSSSTTSSSVDAGRDTGAVHRGGPEGGVVGNLMAIPSDSGKNPLESGFVGNLMVAVEASGPDGTTEEAGADAKPLDAGADAAKDATSSLEGGFVDAGDSGH